MPSRLCLKRIELFGFKSFADRTVFQFGEGVSGVVGPNGCGKSNVADAFRWVMGEQSAKSLRGEKMQDVIFAGTAKRKPGNLCEVTLTFTGASSVLPVPYNELAVTRRLHRSGESEYRLNGQTVRLKDIHSLFWDSGIGKDAFAIFEQGRIEEIISRSPEERRPIFEQAAGIHGYRQRWREAERKLVQTEANLTRLGDIVAEVEKQVSVLEKQVGEAHRFKANRERLAELEEGLVVARWRRSDGMRQKLSKELAGLHAGLDQAKENRNQVEAEHRQVQGELQSREEALKTLREEVYKARSAKEVKTVEGQSCQQRLEAVDKQESRLSQDWETLFTSRKEVKERIHQQRLLKKELVPKRKQVEAAYAGSQNQVQGLQDEVQKLRDQQQRVQRERMELTEKVHSLAAQLREQTVRKETADSRLARLDEEIGAAETTSAALEKLVTERTAQVKELSAAVEKAKQTGEKVRAKLGQEEETASKAKSDLEGLSLDLTEAIARERVLLRLKEEMEGFSSSAKKLLKKFKGKVCPLYEEITFDESLAPAMRPYQQTLFASTDATLKAVLAEGLSDFSITTKKLLKGELFDGVEVTSAGHCIDGQGVLFCGGEAESNTFLRETELKKLGTQIPALKSRKEKLEGALAKALDQQSLLKEELAHVDADHRRAEMKQMEANFALQSSRQELTERKEKLTDWIAERKECLGLSKSLGQALVKLAADQAKGQERLNQREATFETVEEQLQVGLDSLRMRGEEHLQKEAAFQKVMEEWRNVEHNLQILQSKEEAFAEQEVRIKGDRQELTSARKELSATIANFGKLMKGVDGELAQAIKRSEKLEAELERWGAKLAKARERLQAGGDKRRALEERAHEIEISLAQVQTACEGFVDELRERFNLELEAVVDRDYKLKSTLEENEREVRSLRRAIEQADHVNLGAIEEFEACTARHGELAAQVGDLEATRTELQAIIEELDTASRTKFEQTFQKIRESFQRQFQTLFDGGEADLKFVGSNDLLEAGIDLIAKPPGKKMRSIKLLSGGEKCMTAMALLFAVFETKPAPFCILDEMDAPLDDANVKRFLNVLKPFMDETQFLLITHNKLTMAVADVLYGVSMEEKGVSKQISIRFEKKPEPALC